MTIACWPWMKKIACCLAILMIVQAAEAAAQTGQDNAAPQTQGTASQNGQNQTLDAASTSATNASADQTDASAGNTAPAQSAQPSAPSDQQPNSPTPAVGTAAAPAARNEGVAASRLTGAAIAPAKQHRVRTILIRVGIIAGACVAIGTVVALTHATPSQPK